MPCAEYDHAHAEPWTWRPAPAVVHWGVGYNTPANISFAIYLLCPPTHNNSSTWTTTPRRASIRASSRRCCRISTRNSAIHIASMLPDTKHATPLTLHVNVLQATLEPTRAKSFSLAAL